ncbi:MAG: M81 family metallopeptidase [Chloroflexota bacterium]
MKRVLLAYLVQETCSFAPGKMDLADFRKYFLLFGDEIIPALRDGDSEVAGIIAAAAEEGVDLVPIVASYGGTGGPVTDAAYAYLREQILDGVRREASAVNGAILPLHGAMLTESLDDPEGDLIAAVREALGPDKPLVCSLDMHAHVTDLMVARADALVGYHTHPHVDLYDAGYRAMKILARTLRGEVKPVMAHRKVRMVSAPEAHNTTRGPMAEVMGHILALEKEPGMLSASLFAVQPQLDIPNLGWSAIAVADGYEAKAQGTADEIAELAWENRRRFLVQRTPLNEALRAVRETPGGPVVLAESSDSTSGGAEGDSPLVLEALLADPVPGPSLLVMTDPEAVAKCVETGVRGEVTLDVGGKLATAFFRPLRVTGRVRTISDGVFQMKNPRMPADRGRTAVLQIGDIYLVLSERPVYTWDEECYRSVGLFPREAKVVLLKSPGGFRPIYEPFAAKIIVLDTPGPTDSELTRLPYRRLTRPLWPFDPDLAEPW